MTAATSKALEATRHALNNLLAKVVGAAELGLDQAREPGVRAELELILALAEEGASLVASLSWPGDGG